MAIQFTETFPINVTSTATVLINKLVYGNHITIVNNSSANTLYIGNSAVTATTGIPVAPGASYEVDIRSGDTATFYGICASGQTATVIVGTLQ